MGGDEDRKDLTYYMAASSDDDHHRCDKPLKSRKCRTTRQLTATTKNPQQHTHKILQVCVCRSHVSAPGESQVEFIIDHTFVCIFLGAPSRLVRNHILINVSRLRHPKPLTHIHTLLAHENCIKLTSNWRVRRARASRSLGVTIKKA